MAELRNPYWGKISNPEGYANRMTEKERILFIREYGSEDQKRGLKAIFKGNKFKPVRKEMWKRIGKGKRMVQTIVEKKIGEHIGDV